nr:transposase [Halovivax sp.]
MRPLRKRDELLLLELLTAAASLWNEITYARRQALFAGENVWEAGIESRCSRYKGTLGSANSQQIARRSDEAWRSFFALRDGGSNPKPPGYWKEGDQRDLQTLVRNDQYTIEWGTRSRLEIPVGFDLKEKYGLGYYERLRLEARGNPRWDGEQGRLELVYDRCSDSFRARQPVKNARRRRDESLATASSDENAIAALDIGANNLVAVTTTRGDRRLYHGRPQFRRFRRTTEQIAELQSDLESSDRTSRRIRREYRRRTRRRNHVQDALVRDLAEWLRERSVEVVLIGALTGVLSTHWCSRVNEKTHQFWAHKKFRRRLREVLDGEYDIEVREVDESGSSSRCPRCDARDVSRNGDTFRCNECPYEGHSDLVGSENLLRAHANCGSMARPAAPDRNGSGGGYREVPRLEWNDHRWQHRDRSTKVDPANRSIPHREKLASGKSGAT